MSRTEAQHNAHIEAIDRECEANERAAYHRFMNRMAELALAGALHTASESDRAVYANNIAAIRSER